MEQIFSLTGISDSLRRAISEVDGISLNLLTIYKHMTLKVTSAQVVKMQSHQTNY